MIRSFVYILSIFLTLQSYAQEKPALLDYKTFTNGEKLKFVIYYGPITGGIATMKVTPALYNNEPVLHSIMVAKTTGMADRLYKVKDIYEAYFYENTTLPIKSIRDISEGKYKKRDEVLYFHHKNQVKSKLSGIKEVPDEIRDMVSTLFYIRKVDYSTLNEGDIIKINTWFDDEVFPFDMRFQGREKIKTKLGEIRCIKLVPFVEPGRIFKTEDDMMIWISDDANLVPIRIKFDLLVGSLKIDLIEYSGLANGDLQIKD